MVEESRVELGGCGSVREGGESFRLLASREASGRPNGTGVDTGKELFPVLLLGFLDCLEVPVTVVFRVL